jgi:hypothetical protein
MLLNRLRDTLQARDGASVHDLALALGMAPDALRALLETLERKGRVHKQASKSGCGDCCKCNRDALDVYAWGPSEAGVTAPAVVSTTELLRR